MNQRSNCSLNTRADSVTFFRSNTRERKGFDFCNNGSNIFSGDKMTTPILDTFKLLLEVYGKFLKSPPYHVVGVVPLLFEMSYCLAIDLILDCLGKNELRKEELQFCSQEATSMHLQQYRTILLNVFCFDNSAANQWFPISLRIL